MANVFDQAFNKQYYDQYLNAYSKAFVSYQIATKLGLAVLPNSSQIINSVIFSDFRKTMQGLILALQPSKRRDIEKAIGLWQGTQTVMGQVGGRFAAGAGAAEAASGIARTANTLDRLANLVLTKTGFSSVEATNRIISGAAGRYVFIDDLTKLAAGKVRGTEPAGGQTETALRPDSLPQRPNLLQQGCTDKDY